MGDQWQPFIIIRADQAKEEPLKQVKEGTKKYWTKEENLLYIKFFKDFPQVTKNFAQRKSKKMFKMMQALIPTRGSCQIKSHHQKLLLKYHTIENTIRHLQALYSEQSDPLVSLGSSSSLVQVSKENQEKKSCREVRSNQSLTFASFEEEIFNVVNPFNSPQMSEIDYFHDSSS